MMLLYILLPSLLTLFVN